MARARAWLTPCPSCDDALDGGIMRGFRRWPLYGISAVAACTVAMAITGPGSSALAAGSSTAANAVTVTAGPVSPTPASGTPHLVPTGSQDQIIRQLVQCGNTMYAVGRFTQVTSHGSTITRNNIFSFNAANPFNVRAWNPDVNGEVNSIALSGDCTKAYIGGQFTSVGGTAANNIAEISTSTGAVVPGFADNASNIVDTLALTQNGHLLVGGHFGTINGSNAHKYFASLNPVTGADDGFLNLKISGQYHYCNSSGKCNVVFPTQIYNQQLSHSGTLDLVEGVFTKVGGLPRQQIFMLNLATNPATVTGWTSPEFDGSEGNIDVPGGFPYQCFGTEPFYIRAASWSPDDQTVYIATTGLHPWNLPGSGPRSGLCDAVAAFPATQAEVTHTWINYTGCDSLYSTAADASAVYIGGHERWGDNPDECNAQGAGAFPAPGMGGVSPSTGRLLLNSAGTAGLYSRARGRGADDMLLTSAGLWIASDNFDGSSGCNNAPAHAGIMRFPGRRSGLYAAMVVSAAMGMSGLPAAAQAAPSLALATGPVSTKPAAGTPQLAPSGSTEQVRQLVQCGDTMYAVGTFTQI